MQAEKQQSWKINVNARANKFRFKLKAANNMQPSWKFFRISLFLRLHGFLLAVKSETGPPIPRQQPRTLKSKFLKIFQKLKTPSARKRTIAAKKTRNLQHPESKFLADPLERAAYEVFVYVTKLN